MHPFWDIVNKKGYAVPKTQTTIRLEENDYKEALKGINPEEIILDDLKAEHHVS